MDDSAKISPFPPQIDTDGFALVRTNYIVAGPCSTRSVIRRRRLSSARREQQQRHQSEVSQEHDASIVSSRINEENPMGEVPLPPGEGGPKGRVRVTRRNVAAKLTKRARQMRHEDTRAEKLAWILLRDRRMFGLKFRRQVPIDNYIVDFYCHELRLIVELDGLVHDDPIQTRKDERRNARLKHLGYRILRVANGMVMQAPDVFAEEIRRFLPSPGPSGHPLPEGEGSDSNDPTLPEPS